MKDPAVIGLPSNRDNIKLIVKPSINLSDLCQLLSQELVKYRTKTPKTVIFCRSLQQCADMYLTFTRILGSEITEPPGMPTDILEFRMVDIFTAASTTDMRELILKEFSKTESTLRLIVASSAFGLGVDCPDIARIINWGPPTTIEELVQESGRAGRDGSQAEAILYFKKSRNKISEAVQRYGENHLLCRRSTLFSNFLFYRSSIVIPCKCCDLCAPMCNCSECNKS